MVIIYHNRDLDGICSGAIGKSKYPDAKMIGYDYGDPFDIEQIPMDEPVIIVDVSMTMEMMWEISRRSAHQLTWIDHHVSQAKEYETFVTETGHEWNYVYDNTISACQGIWRYLYPGVPEAFAVTLLGKYDIFADFGSTMWEETIFPFQYGMRVLCNSLETFPVSLFSDSPSTNDMIEHIIKQGEAILVYQRMQNESLMNKSAFEFEFEGLRAVCCNVSSTQFNSQTFASVWDPEKHDIMMPFSFQTTHWVVSLYTDKDEVDCSVIAKSRGGGGHKKAAGFQVKEIYEVFPILNKSEDG